MQAAHQINKTVKADPPKNRLWQLLAAAGPGHSSDLQAGNQPQMTMMNAVHQHLCRLPALVTTETSDKDIILQKAFNYPDIQLF